MQWFVIKGRFLQIIAVKVVGQTYQVNKFVIIKYAEIYGHKSCCIHFQVLFYFIYKISSGTCNLLL